MVNYKIKKCKLCKVEFKPNSGRQLYCATCQIIVSNERCNDYHRRTYKKKGYSQLGENNNNWKGGIGVYRHYLEDIKNCDICGSTKYLLVHHKNHDRNDNRIENLQKLCKRCHQKHHVKRDAKGRFTKV